MFICTRYEPREFSQKTCFLVIAQRLILNFDTRHLALEQTTDARLEKIKRIDY